ncbi:MAG: FUSC family protein [Plesiomonas sp.]|uniref:FUSC family protein n=1 Tax=Plesiomonas sp. TaxID=2486279 RepID=UPI003F3FDF8D
MKKLFSCLLEWLPSRSDLPDGVRISIPMILILLICVWAGQPAAGVGGLITAWLVGVLGRDLSYPKRAQVLSLSGVICIVATIMAQFYQISPWFGMLLLSLFGIIYGLMGNQRKHIQLIAYNFGFTLIMALHFAQEGVDWKIILAANSGAVFLAFFFSLLGWCGGSARQGEHLLQTVNDHLAEYVQSLASYAFTDPRQTLVQRERFDSALGVLANWLHSIPITLRSRRYYREFKAMLAFSGSLNSLARTLYELDQHEKLAWDTRKWLMAVSTAIRSLQSELPEFHAEQGSDAALSVALSVRCIQQAWQQKNQRLQNTHNCWNKDEIERVWPSDKVSFLENLSTACQWGSREIQHGLRMMVVMTCAQSLALYFHVQQGYWITLTAFIVLLTAPLGAAQKRIRCRFYGSLMGGVLALGILEWVHDSPIILLLTCIVTFMAFATYYKSRYEVHVFWLTMLIVFAIAQMNPTEPVIALYRVFDTLLGTALAFLSIHLIMPSWTRLWIDSHVIRFIKQEILLLSAINQCADNVHVYLWQANRAYRKLHEEVNFLHLEPNASPRNLQDWRSLLLLFVRLHDAIQSLYEQQQTQRVYTEYVMHSEHIESLKVRIDHLEQWAIAFPLRHQSIVMPKNQLLVEPLYAFWRLSLIDCDLTQLTHWLEHQRPFTLD